MRDGYLLPEGALWKLWCRPLFEESSLPSSPLSLKSESSRKTMLTWVCSSNTTRLAIALASSSPSPFSSSSSISARASASSMGLGSLMRFTSAIHHRWRRARTPQHRLSPTPRMWTVGTLSALVVLPSRRRRHHPSPAYFIAL